MRLYRHQREIIENAPKKHLLAWGTGTGKSLACIKLSELYGIHNVLVICPKSIKEQWRSEIRKFAYEHRLFTVKTKEEFKRDWKDLTKFRKIIIDEAHHFSGYKSQLHKTLIKYININKPEQIYLATATPYLSTIWNIYSLGKILGFDWKWHKWRRYFFHEVQMGRRTIPQEKRQIDGVPMEKIVADIINNKLGGSVKLEDCIDVPKQTFLTEKFDLTKEQLNGMESIEDVNHIVYWTKCHQIGGGTLKSDGYIEDQFFQCEKLNRVLELCKENKKLVIVCRYNNELDLLESKIKNKKVIKINGQTKDRSSAVVEADFLQDCVVLVNAACSEGYELPTFSMMVFYSYDFSLKNYIQMLGRIQRINNLKKNVYISLINRDSIDEDVYKSIQRKENFDIEIYKK
jgi:superfamily II DNA or RNA helicase